MSNKVVLVVIAVVIAVAALGGGFLLGRTSAETARGPRGAFAQLTDAERQQIAKLLRYIDEARRALERQQNADNRDIIRDLRASADQIYDLLNDLEETGG